jgi:hypothetical protein
VVLTPAVYAVARQAEVKPLPLLFACALVANAASFVLPISNPANLVLYASELPRLGAWLGAFALPSVLALLATYAGLRFLFRDALSGTAAQGEGVSLSTGTFSSTTLPLITTRRAATTVQLFDGQSFAIGGLIRSSGSATVNALPLLGELPVLGALFRSTQFQEDKSELVFIVTPRLIKPLPPEYPLPTDKVGLPDRNSLMLNGRLDSAPEGRAALLEPMQQRPVQTVPVTGTPTRAPGFEIK